MISSFYSAQVSAESEQGLAQISAGDTV